MKNNSAVVAIMVLAVLSGAAYLFFSRPSVNLTLGLLNANDKMIVAQGKELYTANCASCHGVELEGEANWQDPKADGTMPAPPHDETGHTWHHKDQLLFDLTKFGLAKYLKQPDYKTSMPVYDGVLSDEEIIAVLSYIKSTWPKEIQETHNKLNSAGSN